MSTITKAAKERLVSLIQQGWILYNSLVYEELPEEKKKAFLKEVGISAEQLVNFNLKYQIWYSEALLSVKMYISDRVNDFVQLYKNEKRKNIDVSTYTVYDALMGISVSRGQIPVFGREAAQAKMVQQISILSSALKLVDSVIYTMNFSIRADLFDSEFDAAGELLRAGFLRASGAMCGVLLEKHLSQVCLQHDVPLKKRSPTINDYNEELKNASIIDLPTWRYIQLLGDLRNLCCHDKSVEPTKEQANDLLTGAIKISKTVY